MSLSWSLTSFQTPKTVFVIVFVTPLQLRAERVGLEGAGKARGDERRAGLVPAGPRRRLRPRRLLPLPVRRGVRGGGFILVRTPKKHPKKRVKSAYMNTKPELQASSAGAWTGSEWCDLIGRQLKEEATGSESSKLMSHQNLLCY